MSKNELEAALAVASKAVSALASGDWKGVAKLVDMDDVREWYEAFLPPTDEPLPDLTARDLQHDQPGMPDAVAEYQAAEVNRRRREARESLHGQFAELSTRYELAETDPVEALSRYLQAQDPNWRYEQHLARLGRSVGRDPSEVPLQSRRILGGVLETVDVAHVLYKFTWRGDSDAPGEGDMRVATLRRTTGGWRLRLRGELFEHGNYGFMGEPREDQGAPEPSS
jgi:hypothetical protein